MRAQKIMETIFTLVMLLFLATMVLGVLVGVSIVQQLMDFQLDIKVQICFIGGMFAVFIYIMKMIIDRIKEYNRSI